MAISVLKQALEIEELVGSRQGQALLRAEAIVPGAGRDAIETLMSEADLVIGQVDVQEGRVVLEGTAHCQAVYRQGGEASLRSLTAQAQLNHAFELPGSAGDMPCRVAGEVEHVEAKYENGHMVFLVSVGLKLQVWKLTPAEIVTGVEGSPALETESETVRSVRLAAESDVDTLLSETVALPAALDAQTALMSWGTVVVEGVEPDLGGVRVRGKLNVEALVASGVAGRPVALIKVPLAFERLVEMPDWLVENVYATARLQRLETRVETGEDWVRVGGLGLRGVRQDLRQTPDLGPVLALTAAFAQGESRLSGVQRLRMKESDRLEAVVQALQALGMEAKAGEDELELPGGGLEGGVCEGFGDHRMVMALAVAATACRGEVTILGAQAVDKSYPGFFRDFERLGGKIQWHP